MTRTWVLILTLGAAATARAEQKPFVGPPLPPGPVAHPAVAPCPTAASCGCCAKHGRDCPSCWGDGQILDWLCYRGCRSGCVGCCCTVRIPHLYLFFMDHPCVGGYCPAAEPGCRNCPCVSGGCGGCCK
jgi:hypothetical protein